MNPLLGPSLFHNLPASIVVFLSAVHTMRYPSASLSCDTTCPLLTSEVVSLPLATGAVPGMLGGMGMGMGDKTVRELFVGNTPQGTSDFVLLEFLNAAMKQVSLLVSTHPHTPKMKDQAAQFPLQGRTAWHSR